MQIVMYIGIIVGARIQLIDCLLLFCFGVGRPFAFDNYYLVAIVTYTFAFHLKALGCLHVIVWNFHQDYVSNIWYSHPPKHPHLQPPLDIISFSTPPLSTLYPTKTWGRPFIRLADHITTVKPMHIKSHTIIYIINFLGHNTRIF